MAASYIIRHRETLIEREREKQENPYCVVVTAAIVYQLFFG
jgi:hypothetical protein